MIDTTATGALPKGNTSYEVWFGRKPPTDFLNHKETVSREGESDENSSSDSGEDSLFVDEEAQQEEEAEEMILSELTKRVAEYMRKQRENIVKRANSKALEYEIQEIITLQIPKQYRFGTEIARIPVRVLEKTPKGYRLTTKHGTSEVTYFLGQIYSNKELKLAGIIYLHRITDNRMGGSTLKNLNMFEALCGTTDLSHVVLATTMWDKMVDPDNRKKAIRFEQDLQRDYWGDMIEIGSKTFHHDDTKGSAMHIVDHILSLRGDMTAAGQQLQKDLLEERKRHEKLLKEAQEAHQAAIKARNKRMMDAMEKQERRHTEKLKEFEKGLDEEKNNIRKDFERLQEEGRKRYQDMIDRAERDKRNAEEHTRAAEAELQEVHAKQEGIDAKMKRMEEDSNEKESRLLAQLAKERLENQITITRASKNGI
ncbi:hypothetical protein F5882DRAFT_465591 [Hyaloscypha sp. PMI_1271]|nr:hypothetical protein F5882DRAFT_465591 [Hyaloscypha sp. PMI_1271]